MWSEVRQDLLDHLSSGPAGCLCGVTNTSGAGRPLQILHASFCILFDLFGTVASGLAAISMFS